MPAGPVMKWTPPPIAAAFTPASDLSPESRRPFHPGQRFIARIRTPFPAGRQRPGPGHLLVRIGRMLMVLRQQRQRRYGNRRDRERNLLHGGNYSTFATEKTAEIAENAEKRFLCGLCVLPGFFLASSYQ